MSQNRPPAFEKRLPFVRRTGRRLAVGLGCTILAAPLARSQEPTRPISVAEAISQEVRTVFSHCRSAIVRIEGTDAHGELSGTGFFVDPNGTIFTSYTVGGEARDLMISDGARTLPARRLVADPRSGIAILKVDAETPFLTLGKARSLALAAPVIAIGYPMDLPASPSFGTIAGFDIKYGGRYFATAHLRANVSVQRGQGGAPLLNLRGEVVGILISSLDSGSAAFALPIEAAEKVHKDFVRFGEVRPGWMGIGIRPAETTVAGSTALVDEIFADAPAQKSGLEKDDRVLQIGDIPIATPDDVRNAAFFTTAEDELILKVWRNGAEISLKITPTDHPSSAHAATPQLPRLQGIPLSTPGAIPAPEPFDIDR